MATNNKLGRPRGARDGAPGKLVQIGMHPQIHKELKLATIREDFPSCAEWLHYHLCQLLGREDLLRDDG